MYKRWSIGFNNYWFTSSIFLEEVPMGLCFLEWLVSWICYFIPSIKLPKIKFKLRDKEDWGFTENKDGWTNLRGWYGDLHQLWHAFICIPVIDFVYKHTKTEIINLPFNFMQEKFSNEYIDNDYDENDDKDDVKANKNRKVADQLDKEFKNVYNKLNYDYLRKRRD